MGGENREKRKVVVVDVEDGDAGADLEDAQYEGASRRRSGPGGAAVAIRFSSHELRRPQKRPCFVFITMKTRPHRS